MKKLFLCSSFSDVANKFKKFENKELSGSRVTFIPTASNPEKVKFYVNTAKKAFEKLGMIIDELDVSNSEKSEIEKLITQNDYIYISGGNTFYLLQELKKSGADDIIINAVLAGKVYIGESAGSIVTATDITYVEKMDDRTEATGLTNTKGLGLVDIFPVPHYTNVPFKEVVQEIIADYDAELALKPIKNSQAIIIKDDQLEII